jgi:uncharacterized protein involved in response to NO
MKSWTPLEQLRDGFCFIVGGVIILTRLAAWTLVWLLARPVVFVINVALDRKRETTRCN